MTFDNFGNGPSRVSNDIPIPLTLTLSHGNGTVDSRFGYSGSFSNIPVGVRKQSNPKTSRTTQIKKNLL